MDERFIVLCMNAISILLCFKKMQLCSCLYLFIVPSPTVTVGFSTRGAITYAGNNVTLNCAIGLEGMVTDDDVTVSSMWTKDDVAFTGVSGRVTIPIQIRINDASFLRRLVFSPLSSSVDNDTYKCVVTLTPRQPQFVTAVMGSGSISLAVQGEVRENFHELSYTHPQSTCATDSKHQVTTKFFIVYVTSEVTM